MELWVAVRAVHLLAMAFFIGGQILLAVLVPVLRGKPEMRLVARRFLHASGVALLLLILTGIYMAGHYDRWDDHVLWAKLTLLVLVFALIGYHVRHGEKRWVDPVLGVLSISIAVLGVVIAHG